MSEVKRGAFDGEGYFVCRVNVYGLEYDVVLRKVGGHYVSHTGAVFSADQILAHRKHEPIKVPELKKIHDPFRKAVIYVREGNDKGPFVAVIDKDGRALYEFKNYSGFAESTVWPMHGCTGGYEELTREQCEREHGVSWPF